MGSNCLKRAALGTKTEGSTVDRGLDDLLNSTFSTMYLVKLLHISTESSMLADRGSFKMEFRVLKRTLGLWQCTVAM